MAKAKAASFGFKVKELHFGKENEHASRPTPGLTGRLPAVDIIFNLTGDEFSLEVRSRRRST